MTLQLQMQGGRGWARSWFVQRSSLSAASVFLHLPLPRASRRVPFVARGAAPRPAWLYRGL